MLTIGVQLKSMGYTVHAAGNPVNAERLQTLISAAATPIGFVTAGGKPGLHERALQLGSVTFVKKCFGATTLADAIESALWPGLSWQPQVSVV